MLIFTGMTWVTFWKFPELFDCGSGENTPAAPPWISRTEPVNVRAGVGVDGEVDAAGPRAPRRCRSRRRAR